MSRFEASETVRMRAGLVRRDPQRRARVGVAEAVRQILRKAQMDAVVDRDHRAARRQRRQHVVRRVEQVGPLAPQVERHAHLLAHGVGRRALGDRAGSSRPSAAATARSPPARQSSTYSVDWSSRDEVPQQVPDVGADAVIAQLARVDGYAHVSGILSAAPAAPAGQEPVSAEVERAAAAPSADGASRRTPAGCGGRRRSSPPEPSRGSGRAGA